MNNGETRDAGLAIAPPLLPDHPPMFRHLDPAAALAFRTPLQEHPAAADTKATGAIAPVPRISTKSGPFSPGEWLESLPGSARGY